MVDEVLQERQLIPKKEPSFSLEEFDDELLNVDIEEFVPETPVASKSFSSETNRAAFVSALTNQPSNIHNVVNTATAEGSASGSTIDTMIQQVKEENFNQSKEDMVEVVLDNELGDQERKLVAQDLVNKNKDFMTTREILATETLVQPNGPKETIGEEEYRNSAAVMMQDIAEENNYRESLINSQLISSNKSFMGNFTDVAAHIGIPEVEQIYVNNVLSTFTATQNGKIPGTSITVPERFTFRPDSLSKNAIVLMGEAKQWLIDELRKAPHSEKITMMRHIKEAIDGHSGLTLKDDNDFAQYHALTQFIDQGAYGNVDRFLDNAISLLDATFIGSLLPHRYLMKGLQKAGNVVIGSSVAANRASNLEIMSRARPSHKPSSVEGTVVHTNPDDAKKIHRAVVSDETDSTAIALTGVTREEAIAGDLLFDVKPTITFKQGEKPRTKAQAQLEGGKGKGTPPPEKEPTGAPREPEGTLKFDETINDDIFPDRIHNMGVRDIEGVQYQPAIAKHVGDTGALHLFPTEKVKASKQVVHDWGNIAGLRLVHEMSQVGDSVNLATRTSDGVHIKAVYKPNDGTGWTTAGDAIEEAGFALRNKGRKVNTLYRLNINMNSILMIFKNGT
jgi:hypothetical protein